MADKLMRAIVTIPRVSGVPEDAITNTWYFDGDDGNPDASYHSAIQTQLTEFYQAIDTYLSQMTTTPAHVKLYDMRDALPRVPEFEFDIALTQGAGGWLPAEVAVCLSFQAAPESGISQRRRRGRVYLGPINESAVTEVGGDKRPSSTLLAAVAAAATALKSEPMDIGSNRWSVYSPTTDLTGTVDDAFNDVDNGWIDNSFDTQRRRGAAATLRTTW